MVNQLGALALSGSVSINQEVGSTMRYRIAVGSPLALLLLAGSLVAGETLKSGPQVGDRIPGPFNPLNVTGSAAGEKVCQV
jgi:hypothetical protein